MNPTSVQKAAFEQEWARPTGWTGIFSAVNNQRLGIRFMATAFVFLGLGGLLALLMRLQLAVPENDLLGPQTYNALFTLHGSTMMFLFAVPFLEGLALYLLPLMIGSRDVAFPRLTAFSYWTYLFGGLVFYASLLTGSPPDAGWFAYAPLSGPAYAGRGMDYWVMGLALVEIAGLAAGIEIVVTILKLRAPGMSLGRMPMLAWTLLVSGAMMIFAFTVLLVATTLLELDRVVGMRFFDPDYGGSSLLWQHLFWFFGHPEVYIMFLPATGIVSTIVSTAARRPLAAYPLVAMAVMVTGFVSFGLWMHHMYTTGLPELGLSFFAAASLMIGVASGIQVFSWIATLWGTRPVMTTAFLYVLGFFFVFVLGGFTGVMIAVVPFDWQVHDTFFIVAHFHYVLVGGVLFPIFAALYYWAPKVTGFHPDERWGRLGFWLNFAGFNLTFFPMHIMGLLGLPRRVYTYPRELGLTSYNLASTVGAIVMGTAFVIMVYGFWRKREGRSAGDNPQGTGTLDGSSSSPPPVYNFLQPPIVSGRDPLWEKSSDSSHLRMEQLSVALTAFPTDWRATVSTDAISGQPTGIQPLAGPSLAPFAAAVGLLIAFVGILAKSYLLVPLGVIATAGAAGRWLYPRPDRFQRITGSGISERSGLPVFLTGADSTVWWGMLGLVTTGATAFGAFIYAYFYLQLFAPVWPPAGHPPPAHGFATVAAGVLAAGAVGTWRAKANLLTGTRRPVRPFLAVAVLGTTLSLVAASVGLSGVEYGFREHAYGSIYWTLVIASLLTSLVSLGLQVCAWIRFETAEKSETPLVVLQFQLTSLFALFAAAAGAAVFVVLHLSPLFLR